MVGCESSYVKEWDSGNISETLYLTNTPTNDAVADRAGGVAIRFRPR